ncbi:putative protein kinase [Erysiphe necator]|uniref:non-specific serine/threonine protein kinase n=1 Tax=Uncinula necator TaxID=52586 RepID=A0A0B1P6I6_UNCNE|nr:putative protein kinase [Erysiphe necator]
MQLSGRHEKKASQKDCLDEFPSLGNDRLKNKKKSLVSLYEEIQGDELIALAAIYGDDFKRISSSRGAWNKSEPCFEIRIRSSNEDIAVTLLVSFTPSYPKTPPILSLKDGTGLKEVTKAALLRIIEKKPLELVAEEQAMVMEIVNECLYILEEAAQADAADRNIPSLEIERTTLQDAAIKKAEHEKEREDKQKEQEALEKERIQETLVKDEITRQKAKAREKRRKNRPPVFDSDLTYINENKSGEGHEEILSFEQPIRILDIDRNPVSFQNVAKKILIRQGPSSSCFAVRPVVSRKSSNVPTLALKQTILAIEIQKNSHKVQLQSLESDLRLLKNINHQNILQFFDFRVHKNSEEIGEIETGWTINILTEYAEKGSLQEFVDIAGSISVERVRSWTIELLDALQFIHEKGIVHGDLHIGNVMLVRSLSGEVRPKLADALYQRRIHDLVDQKQPFNKIPNTKSSYWTPPELIKTNQPNYNQKTDIWCFGTLFLQMIFGLSIINDYSSPAALVESTTLSVALNEFVLKMFKTDFKKRPRAVELISSGFLATEATVYEETSTASIGSKLHASILPTSQSGIRPDLVSKYYSSGQSRYREDFVEVGRLGKGGFGEVVKARKRLDGQLYAIKKIVQKPTTSLDEVLKEVRLLSQLSHPSVVRYFNTWTEEISDDFETNEQITGNDSILVYNSTESSMPINSSSIECCDNTVGLDFMSSNNYPQIEFTYEDITDEEEHDSLDPKNSNDNIVRAKKNNLDLDRSRYKTQSNRIKKIVLYISMEYCEKQTLRDLIKRGLHENEEEIWRLFREILEGLSYIHSQNIVHRDLKPENIFIDAASNIKIGDFGLAINGQYPLIDISQDVVLYSADLTRNIGTAFYVAPEVKSSTGGDYSSKVDMFSVGIIFFEMCFRPLIPGMDRASVGCGLRNINPIFPDEFQASERQPQAEIILSLLCHDADKRPSSSELLKSGKLPLQMENEAIRQTFSKLTDPNSPYFDQIMKNLFSLQNDVAKDHAWEVEHMNSRSAEFLLTCSIIRQRLVEIFRRHGAIETTRTILFPRSSHYGSNSMQLLERNGTILQLPYDLTLPFARAIAKHPFYERSFTFGQVFRDRETGGQPQTFGEADFDIVSTDSSDFTLKEAEVIKVLDEIVGSFPSLSASKMCFHINHSDLLGYVFDFCRIDPSIRNIVANTLSKLNIQSWTWQKIQLELKSPLIGLSTPSVDDLQRFNFRDTPTLAFQKLKILFEGTNIYEKATSAITHLQEVLLYTKRFEIKNTIYITPLGSLNEKFYKGGLLFSCLFDRKIKDVFAAGGRYDSLIQEHSNKANNRIAPRYAVGFNLAWEKIARKSKARLKSSLKKVEEDIDTWNNRRCDVLVASHDTIILRTVGITILQMLWSYSISAELARDSHSSEDLLSKYRDDQHSWIIIIKQDSVLKVKSMVRKDAKDIDISPDQLVSFLKTEMRERDRKYGTHQREKLQQMSNVSEVGCNQDVMILISGTKSKKSNRRNIIEQAQACALSLTHEMLRGPIAAIEITDQVMENIKSTKLSEPETWRSLSQVVPMAERKYLGEVQSMLLKIKEQNINVTRYAFIYNFRSGKCIFYDLSA